MANLVQEFTIGCPYCAETISILVDGSVEEQQYIEDCEVCCRPMVLTVRASPDGLVDVEARGEND